MNEKLLELVESGGLVAKVIVRRCELEDLVDDDSSFDLEEGSLVFVLLSFLLFLLVGVLLGHHFFFLQVLFVLFDLRLH